MHLFIVYIVSSKILYPVSSCNQPDAEEYGSSLVFLTLIVNFTLVFRTQNKTHHPVGYQYIFGKWLKWANRIFKYNSRRKMVSKTCSSMTTSEKFFFFFMVCLYCSFLPVCILFFDLLAFVKYVVLNVKYTLIICLNQHTKQYIKVTTSRSLCLLAPVISAFCSHPCLF